MTSPDGPKQLRSRRSPRPGLYQRMLGLFIVWQIIFICAVNALGLAHVNVWPQRVFGRWSQLTGQWQGWGFFANFMTPYCTFVEVDLKWPERTETVRSIFEPANPESYFQPNFKSCRRFNYETRFDFYWLILDKELFARAPPGAWHTHMAGFLELHGESIYSYLRLYLHKYQRAHPNMPLPCQVILKLRIYEKPVPGQSPANPTVAEVRPLILWRPGFEPPDGHWPLEVFDPNSGLPELYVYAANDSSTR